MNPKEKHLRQSGKCACEEIGKEVENCGRTSWKWRIGNLETSWPACAARQSSKCSKIKIVSKEFFLLSGQKKLKNWTGPCCVAIFEGNKKALTASETSCIGVMIRGAFDQGGRSTDDKSLALALMTRKARAPHLQSLDCPPLC